MKKTWISLVLTAAMLFSLIAPAFAVDTYCAVITFAEEDEADAACAAWESLSGLQIRWRYHEIFHGVAIEGCAGVLRQAVSCCQLATFSLSQTWAEPQSETVTADSSNSLDVMHADKLEQQGDGMVIAVIDSGLAVTHEAFQEYGLQETPALLREDIDTFIDNGGTQGRYISQKIPFAYDYNGQDRSVHSTSSHGTHVAGLAVGYAANDDGSVKFTGVAPAAQLLFMKVFPDNASLGAEDVDIFQALEDALLLGADVVNLSLGTEGDFTQGGENAALYREAFAALRDAGVVVCCAAGNSGDALFDKQDGILFPTADYTDYGAACIPAAYDGTVAVGAVNTVKQEGSSMLLVNDTAFRYIKGEPEEDTLTLPALSALAGQELPYVMVDGVGTESDFAGYDLTGCVAVVARGTLYFTEKVKNAAAAGAIACLIYNNESGSFRPVVNDSSIPCAMISQTAGEYLAACAENGRGTVRFPAEGEMVDTHAPLSMLSASAWGVTSDLRLVPTLCAAGGEVYSAVNGTTDAYDYLSGTSMATPNAAGAFAIVLEALKQRGITDKVERATLAEQLLTSTATQVSTEDGTPLSPRQQGAGVINLTAALESPAVITEPILSLGDGWEDTVSLSFSVKNLSDEDITFSVTPTVLTDAFGKLGERYYTMMTPLDVTKYMTFSTPQTVSIRAGETQTVSVTFTPDTALLETLAEVYPNGFFFEGYVTLTDSSGETLHATFTSYYGDWNAAPVLEPVDFRDLMNALADGEEDDPTQLMDILGVNFGYNLAYLDGASADQAPKQLLGQNLLADVPANETRLAIAAQDSDAHAFVGCGFTIDLYTLRNAAHVIMAVVDNDTGAIYYVDDTPNLPRADFDDTTGLAVNTGLFYWDGTDAAGTPLPHGTTVTVVFYAWTEYNTVMQDAYAETESDMENPESFRWLLEDIYDASIEWTFPLTIDGCAPTVSMDTERDSLRLTVTENEFLACATVYNSAGDILLENWFADDTRGESHILSIPCPQDAQPLFLVLSDYASNTVGYSLSLSDGVTRCPAALFSDVSSQAWYHDAVDFVCEEGLLDADSFETFAPDKTTTRATVVDVLYRLAGTPAHTEAALPFLDISEEDTFRNAIQWAYEQGIVHGYSQTQFAADASISRQQLAVMLYRAAQQHGDVTQYDTAVLTSFRDSDAIADWARDAMVWAVGEGILQGVGQGLLSPETALTRAQLAQILWLLFQT